MQLFEFSKQLLVALKKEKDAQLARHGDKRATPDHPIRLISHAELSYDTDNAFPIRELHFALKGETTPTRDFTLTVPEAVKINDEHDLDKWLSSVFEFIANAHGMAMERSLDKVADPDRPPLAARIFLSPTDWETRLVATEGKLSELPMTLAINEMDKLERNTLSGWRQSEKFPDANFKTFRSEQAAEHARELLHLILEVNGCEDMALRKALRVTSKDGEKFRLVAPKDLLNRALRGEQYIG